MGAREAQLRARAAQAVVRDGGNEASLRPLRDLTAGAVDLERGSEYPEAASPPSNVGAGPRSATQVGLLATPSKTSSMVLAVVPDHLQRIDVYTLETARIDGVHLLPLLARSPSE